MTQPQTPPPTLRDNHRYIIFRIDSNQAHGFSPVYDAAWNAFLSCLGVTGTAAATPWIMKDLWRKETQVGGIRVTRGEEHAVTAALTTVTTINDAPARLHVLDVTGTMKTAREQYDVAD